MNDFKKGNFVNDAEKMRDFHRLTKEEFLQSYSYLTEEEYDNTRSIIGEIKGFVECEVGFYIVYGKWQKREHKANIPALTEKYRKEARGLVIEEELDFWDRCVPIRLDDLYQGMELGCTLSIIRVMKDESISLDERLVKARRVFDSQGHSGMSASLMFSMLYKFCPNGKKLVEYLME